MQTTLLVDGNAVSYMVPVLKCKSVDDFIKYFLIKVRDYSTSISSNNLSHKAILFFDDKKDNWREKLYPDYQRKRKEAKKSLTSSKLEEDNLRSNYMSIFKDKLNRSNKYLYLHCSNTETDDLMAIYCSNIKKDNEKVIIITTDKDLYQLVNKDSNISLLSIVKHEIIQDRSEGKRVLEEKIWLGDPSDSIPGVCKNVGKKSFDDLKTFIDKMNELEKDPTDKILSRKICEDANIKYIPSFSNFSKEQLDINRKLIDLSYVLELDKLDGFVKTQYLKNNCEKAKFSPYSVYSILQDLCKY